MGIAANVDFDDMAQVAEDVQPTNQDAVVVTADLKQEVMLGAADCADCEDGSKEDK